MPSLRPVSAAPGPAYPAWSSPAGPGLAVRRALLRAAASMLLSLSGCGTVVSGASFTGAAAPAPASPPPEPSGPRLEWIHLPVRLQFHIDQGDLDDDDRSMLAEMPAALASRTDIVRIRVLAYTFEGYDARREHEISLARLRAIVEHLTGELGMPRELFELYVRGSCCPLTGDTAGCGDRDMNERVEFELLVRRDGRGSP